MVYWALALLEDEDEPRWALSVTGSADTEPQRLRPSKEAAEPTRRSCLTNKEGPGWPRSKADATGLVRAWDLKDMLGPTCTRSSTKVKGSSWAELWGDKTGPRCALSVTGSEETGPERMMPTVGAAEPMRLRLRAGMEGSMWPRSGTGSARPRCAELWRDGKGPRSVSSVTDREDTGPKRTNPKIDATGPACAKDLGAWRLDVCTVQGERHRSQACRATQGWGGAEGTGAQGGDRGRSS